jgi:hypothetical protein
VFCLLAGWLAWLCTDHDEEEVGEDGAEEGGLHDAYFVVHQRLCVCVCVCVSQGEWVCCVWVCVCTLKKQRTHTHILTSLPPTSPTYTRTCTPITISTAFPNDAFNSPPTVSPMWSATSSVKSPSIAARGMSVLFVLCVYVRLVGCWGVGVCGGR